MSFAETLRTLRQKSGKSKYRLAQYSGIDQTYILRLESGNKVNPSRDVVMMLALALVQDTDAVGIHEIDELLIAAGYASFRRRGERLALSVGG